MIIYNVKENHIGSTVKEILQYRRTERDPVTVIKGLNLFFYSMRFTVERQEEKKIITR